MNLTPNLNDIIPRCREEISYYSLISKEFVGYGLLILIFFTFLFIIYQRKTIKEIKDKKIKRHLYIMMLLLSIFFNFYIFILIGITESVYYGLGLFFTMIMFIVSFGEFMTDVLK